MKRLFAIGAVFAMLAGAAGIAAQSGSPAEKQLEAARHKAVFDGDLRGAIEQYKQLANGKDRRVAAQALVLLADAYLTLGDAQARDTYQRIVRDFADQKDAVTVARAKLAGDSRGQRADGSITLRPVLEGADSGADRYGAVSRDGRYLSMMDSETDDLAIRDLTTGQLLRVTHKQTAPGSSEFAEYSVFSPDASRLAYGWSNKDGRYELRVINRDGSGTKLLFANGSWLQPYHWSPDGRTILAVVIPETGTSRQLALVAAADGSTRILKTLDWSMGVPSYAAFSPDGRYIAYDRRSVDDADNSDVFIIAVDGSSEREVVMGKARERFLGWFPDGSAILVSSERNGSAAAWSVPVNDGRAVGEGRLLKPDVGLVNPKGFTSNGDFYYFQPVGSVDVSIAEIDAGTGRLTHEPAPLRPRDPRGRFSGLWSPDGTKLLFSSGGQYGLVLGIHDRNSGSTRLVPLALNYLEPSANWIPDGTAVIVAGTDLKMQSGIFRIDLATGTPTALHIDAGGGSGRPQMTRDGRLVYFRRIIRPAGAPVRVVIAHDMVTGEEREVFRGLSDFVLSPDERWLLLRTSRNGIGSLEIIPASGGASRTILRDNTSEYGWMPSLAWTPDNRFVLLGRRPGELWRVPVDGGMPARLDLTLPGLQFVSVSPDGRQLALTSGEIKPQVWAMENLIAASRTSK